MLIASSSFAWSARPPGWVRDRLPSFDPVGDLKRAVVDKLGHAVGTDPRFVSAAISGGWTKGNCESNGLSASIAIAGFYSTAICTALSAGLGDPACFGAVAAAGSAICGLACTQLCNDRHLRGEECGNP